MSATTITEALAELKTIAKRIDKKSEFVLAYLGRVDAARDPLERDGGSVQAIQSERQAIRDLQERTIRIRRAIQKANEANNVVIEGETRSIADWLVWRREVAPQQKKLLEAIRTGINHARNEAKKRDGRILDSATAEGSQKDIVIHVSESDLAKEIERMELVLGVLDGQLSLKNATLTIEV